MSDTATISGGYEVGGGTITFTLTPPSGAAATQTVSVVAGTSSYTVSGGTATQVGTYTWSAEYSGDGLNNVAIEPTTSTEQANETLTTYKASPSITTLASETNSGVVGSAVLSDTATISGGYEVGGGTITFTLTPPSGPAATQTVSVVAGTSSYTVSGGTATQVGTYTWSAEYSGDGLNNVAIEPTTSTEQANETLTTYKASPSITTLASETNSGVVGTRF